MSLKVKALIFGIFLRSILGIPVHVNRPIISISNNSLEAIGIANKINQFFNNQNGDRVEEVNVSPFSRYDIYSKKMLHLT